MGQDRDRGRRATGQVRVRDRRGMVQVRGHVRPDTVVVRVRVRRAAGAMVADTEAAMGVEMAVGMEAVMGVAVRRAGVRGVRTDSECMPTDGLNSGNGVAGVVGALTERLSGGAQSGYRQPPRPGGWPRRGGISGMWC